MFDLRFPTQQSYAYAYLQDAKSSHAAQLHRAHELFNNVVHKGIFLKLLAKVLRRPRCLLDLNGFQPHVVGSSYAGLRAVRIDNIVGSAGRLEDFDLDFLPINDRMRERWVSIAMAANAFAPLPPVELVQVGEEYFVRDGHHRISVARARRQEMIDADVTAWQLDPHFLTNEAHQTRRSWWPARSHSKYLSISW